jgi:hypothetical protein
VASPQGKQAATARLVAVAQEFENPAINARLQAKARELLPGREIPAATMTRLVEQLREQYLVRVFDSIKTLGQPNGAEYLVGVAANASAPLERRKAALGAAQNFVPASQATALFGIVNCAPAPPAATWTFGASRWTASARAATATSCRSSSPSSTRRTAAPPTTGSSCGGSSARRSSSLGGASVIPEFLTHLAVARPAPFAGYTFREVNGEAQAIGDITPPPRAVMRGYLAPTYAPQVRALAVIYLGLKGEASDLTTLDGLRADATAMTGEGWSAEQLGTLGAVATRAREGLNNSLQTLRRVQRMLAPGRALRSSTAT